MVFIECICGSDQNYILNLQKPKGAQKPNHCLLFFLNKMHHIKGHHSHPTSGPATPLTPNTSEPGSSLCVRPTYNTKQSPLERKP